MNYQIVIEKRAQKFIRKQPKPQQERLMRAIAQLPAGDTKALKGNEGLFRLRVGAFLMQEIAGKYTKGINRRNLRTERAAVARRYNAVLGDVGNVTPLNSRRN